MCLVCYPETKSKDENNHRSKDYEVNDKLNNLSSINALSCSYRNKITQTQMI